LCCTAGGGGGGGGGGDCGTPNINQATINLVKEFEGYEPYPYLDPSGYETVGYGHLCQQSGCTEVPYSFPLSESEAAALLQSDMRVRA
jgi:lysozyme